MPVEWARKGITTVPVVHATPCSTTSSCVQKRYIQRNSKGGICAIRTSLGNISVRIVEYMTNQTRRVTARHSRKQVDKQKGQQRFPVIPPVWNARWLSTVQAKRVHQRTGIMSEQNTAVRSVVSPGYATAGVAVCNKNERYAVEMKGNSAAM